MEITVVGRNIAVTDALRSYAEKKVAKLQKLTSRRGYSPARSPWRLSAASTASTSR